MRQKNTKVARIKNLLNKNQSNLFLHEEGTKREIGLKYDSRLGDQLFILAEDEQHASSKPGLAQDAEQRRVGVATNFRQKGENGVLLPGGRRRGGTAGLREVLEDRAESDGEVRDMGRDIGENCVTNSRI